MKGASAWFSGVFEGCQGLGVEVLWIHGVVRRAISMAQTPLVEEEELPAVVWWLFLVWGLSILGAFLLEVWCSPPWCPRLCQRAGHWGGLCRNRSKRAWQWLQTKRAASYEYIKWKSFEIIWRWEFDAVEVLVAHVKFKPERRLVQLTVPKSKTDQGGAGTFRTLACCGLETCESVCPYALAMVAVAQGAGGEGSRPLFPT